MQLFPNGGRVFEVISRYDDLLTLEAREGYEPGDTLALIVPFLVQHNITEPDIVRLAASATFIGGAEKLVKELQSSGWKVFCITTTYEPYAIHLTHKLGIYAHNLASTPFPLAQIRQSSGKEELEMIRRVEADILTMHLVEDDVRIKKTLDEFFWEKLPTTPLGEVIRQVKPIGGRRKVEALKRFADKYNQLLSGWVAVGDSITDFKMLQAVDSVGGLAIAFNANEYALPYATMGLASTHISDLTEVLAAWKQGQRKAAERLVKEKEALGASGDRGHFHWLVGRKNIDDIIALHKRIRRLIREEAGKLG